MCGGPAPNHDGHPLRVKVELPPGDESLPASEIEVVVDDITPFLDGRNKELTGKAEKVLKSIQIKVEEKGLKLSVTEGGKERRVATWFQECSKGGGVGLATSVET